jgi:hypothetical protein
MKKSQKNQYALMQTLLTSSSVNMTDKGNRGILCLKTLVALLLSMSAVLSTPDVSTAAYTITQVTNNSYADETPQINASGWVTWSGSDGTDNEIFLYNGTTVTQITHNSYDDFWPQINANGWVAWYGYDGTDNEIFLYNGTTITQLTNNSANDWEPQINASGWVTWDGYDGTDHEIFLYNGTTVTQLTNNSTDDFRPHINASGWVTWQGWDGTDAEIFLYNGTTITQLTNNGTNDRDPQINTSGWVTWYGSDGADDEIFLYNGTTITQVANNSYADETPQINASGWITWSGYDGTDWEIFLYNGTTVTQITHNSYDDFWPQINANGWVAWYGYDGTDWEIFFYNGITDTQLTNNSYDDDDSQINDSGWVTWQGGSDTDAEIFLAKPSGATPSPPSNLTAKATSSIQIMLGWKDNSTDETHFKIERKTGDCSSISSWALVATKPADATSHNISGLSPNTSYSFRVRAYNSSGDSTYSNCVSAKTGKSGTPPAPSNFKATSASSSKVNLSWKDNSANESGFRIYRKAGAGEWTLLMKTAADIISFSDITATNNNSTTSYQYYVCAYNASGNSPATYTATVPYSPADLTATQGTTAGSIKLTWTDKSTNETGFEIYRKTGACSSTSTWIKIATLGTNKISWTDTGRTSGSSYSYKIRAYRKLGSILSAYGYSKYSGCSSATAP